MRTLLLRLFLWLIVRVTYRITALGADKMPLRGGALLVSNHVSLVDVILIQASTRRTIQFLIPEEVCAWWWIRPWVAFLRIIPMPEDKKALEATLHEAGKIIRSGGVVGVFPEKSISRIGILLPFRREFERIMEGVDAPIMPVCLDGVWGSVFSYQAGRFLWKIPRRPPYPVTVCFGDPMAPNSSATQVRQAIRALNTQAWPNRRKRMRTLGRAFIQQARAHPFRFAMADSMVPGLRFSSALAGAVFLGRRLKKHWGEQQMVGILLPSSVGGALVNMAVLLAGKVPVNLNYTLSAAALESCARQCGLKTVITAKPFLDRLKMTPPANPVFIEEVRKHPRLIEKVSSMALALSAPVRWLERAVGCKHPPDLDDLATVVFSSGSTGDPKGVMLSHYNVASNVAQIGQVFDFGPRQRFIGILPFFHSFGFTATLMEPMVSGLGVVFHSNPLDGKTVGELVRRYGVTTLMATPKFLEIYLRTCEPEDFGSLTFVMAGAEKLSPRVAADFQARFRLTPVEGYGCTECSPVVAANTHDFRAARIFQAGARPGTIGPPLPGISVRFIDADTDLAVADGAPGLMLVRGPNVMQGYLGRPDLTDKVLRDGWYNTGDIAQLDEDGFIRIAGRRSRFSKVAGEMVPHEKVEEELQKLSGATETVLAVTGVADEKKGERLVVLHKLDDAALNRVFEALPRIELPNLWIPKRNQFYRVDSIPLLGTGKLNLHQINHLATELSRQEVAPPPANH